VFAVADGGDDREQCARGRKSELRQRRCLSVTEGVHQAWIHSPNLPQEHSHPSEPACLSTPCSRFANPGRARPRLSGTIL
jgi:hypothetical protein